MHARWPGRRPGTTRRLRVAAAAAVAAALPLAFVMPGAAQAGTGRAGVGPASAGTGAARPGWGHGLVVPTDRGWVRGKHAEGISQWLRSLYPAPPVGALRWAAPHPAPRWHGIRETTAYGGRCAQLASGNGPRVDSENCLYLNVFAPPGAGAGRRGPG